MKPEEIEVEEPPEPWEPRTVVFDNQDTWELFGEVILNKYKMTMEVMNNPDVPAEVNEANRVNLEALEKVLKQYQVIDDERTTPITFQFNKPLEITQVLFACQYGQQATQKINDQEQSDEMKEKRNGIIELTALLADSHWDNDVLDVVTNMDYVPDIQ
jgi:hypothetical protein